MALLLLIGVVVIFTPRVLMKAFAGDDPVISFEEAKRIELNIKDAQRVAQTKKYYSGSTKKGKKTIQSASRAL